MNRLSSSALCVVTLLVGIIIGSAGDRWTIKRVEGANALDSTAADRLYHELKSANSPLQASSDYLAKIARLTTPSVVHIESERRTSHGVVEETGSGVIMQSDKVAGQFIVTNRHVIDKTELQNISIDLHDGRIIHPTRVLTDKLSDVAVLEVSAPNMRSAHWGDSRKLEIGHMVLAMGSPFGLSQSITFGIISAKGRRALHLGSNEDVLNQDFLQTDAAINPGNSGGPLINLQGEVIGINTAIASKGGGNEGIGFSIPSHLARHVIDQLLTYGKVTRAYLGVKLDSEFNTDTARRLHLDRIRGARVLDVYPNSPASRANLKFDDVILVFDGAEVQDENDLINMVSLMPVDKRVKMVVLRNGQRITLDVVVDNREKLPQQRTEAPRTPDMGTPVESLGLTLHPLAPDLAQQLGFPQATSGLLVLNIDPQGPLSKELQLYDVIEEVARTPIRDVDEIDPIIEANPGDSLLLKIQRNLRGETHSQLVLFRR